MMAGPIAKQVKNPNPTLVNGKWVHKHFDPRPLRPEMARRLADMGRRLKLRSA